tara:strand:+ start:464 stop:736 length:273 start_codon:yes stop_codon:yes gene_type:complete
MQDEVTNLELVEEEEVVSKDSILTYLTAIGVNTCRRSYDGDSKAMYEAYLKLPLVNFVDSWEHLDPNVKISILDIHAESFKRWVKESLND